jgi:transposase
MAGDVAQPSYEELVAENATLRQRIAELEAALKTALEQVEAARRAGKRQAAPFSKGPPKEHPKLPGGKVGHPPTHRAKPNQVDRTLEVKLSHATCLKCGGKLIDHTIQVQYQVEIPPVQPIVTQFNIESARCEQCGERVQARHPEQTSDAVGAAAVQIGPRALGLAAEFKHGLGVPYRKVEHVLEEALGLRVAPGTLERAGQRLAAKAEPTYQLLLSTLRQEPLVNGDETGWKVAGRNAWLWVFTSAGLTVYTIDRRRSHEVAERILGKDFAGILSCDCFLAYDALPYRQHKCTGHLLRRCAEVQAAKAGAAAELRQRVARLRRGAITLRERRMNLGANCFGGPVRSWKRRWIGCWKRSRPTRTTPGWGSCCGSITGNC